MVDADLKLSERQIDGIPVLELVGELDTYTCPQFRESMGNLLTKEGKDFVISMSEVEYIDSTGLGALVGGLKRAREKDGRIIIVCTNPQVLRVFEITGLVKVFPIFSTVEEACSMVNSKDGALAAG